MRREKFSSVHTFDLMVLHHQFSSVPRRIKSEPSIQLSDGPDTPNVLTPSAICDCRFAEASPPHRRPRTPPPPPPSSRANDAPPRRAIPAASYPHLLRPWPRGRATHGAWSLASPRSAPAMALLLLRGLHELSPAPAASASGNTASSRRIHRLVAEPRRGRQVRRHR